MDHPLLFLEQKKLRQEVVRLLTTSYSSLRSSNIVFVCGGNDDTHMRMLFRSFCEENLPDFEVFFPEYAMQNLLSTEPDEPFDITDFEQLISELSHAIVVFPEAAGSFAETGYFSAIDSIARRCILVLNLEYQRVDSFISLGPAKKISAKSLFHPLIHLDYENPDFSSISERIKRLDERKYRKALTFEKFKDLSKYQIACLIFQIVEILRIATIYDVIDIFKVIFKNRHSAPEIKKISSILFGAQYLKNTGPYGHMTINTEKRPLLELRDGHVESEREIRLSLMELYQRSDPEFLDLVEQA